MCHRFNEFFFCKVVLISLRPFNSFKHIVYKHPQRKSAMPPRGLATNYNSRRGNQFPHWREGDGLVKEKKERAWENNYNYFKSFQLQKLFHRGQWHERKKQARSAALNGIPQFLTVMQGRSYWIASCSTLALFHRLETVLVITGDRVAGYIRIQRTSLAARSSLFLWSS